MSSTFDAAYTQYRKQGYSRGDATRRAEAKYASTSTSSSKSYSTRPHTRDGYKVQDTCFSSPHGSRLNDFKASSSSSTRPSISHSRSYHTSTTTTSWSTSQSYHDGYKVRSAAPGQPHGASSYRSGRDVDEEMRKVDEGYRKNRERTKDWTDSYASCGDRYKTRTAVPGRADSGYCNSSDSSRGTYSTNSDSSSSSGTYSSGSHGTYSSYQSSSRSDPSSSSSSDRDDSARQYKTRTAAPGGFGFPGSGSKCGFDYGTSGSKSKSNSHTHSNSNAHSGSSWYRTHEAKPQSSHSGSGAGSSSSQSHSSRPGSKPATSGIKPKTDLYVVLGVSKSATADELKTAYRKLAMKLHPDRNVGKEAAATKRIQEVNEAYDVLKDEAKRGMYDKTGKIVV